MERVLPKMREILFIGKRVIDGKWAESCCPLGEMHSGTVTYDFASETVCQYTGLAYKNGAKIFDGDILSAHLDDQHPEDITYVQITWDGFSWCTRESTQNEIMSERDCKNFEVCGNIFDNPELLKG